MFCTILAATPRSGRGAGAGRCGRAAFAGGAVGFAFAGAAWRAPASRRVVAVGVAGAPAAPRPRRLEAGRCGWCRRGARRCRCRARAVVPRRWRRAVRGRSRAAGRRVSGLVIGEEVVPGRRRRWPGRPGTAGTCRRRSTRWDRSPPVGCPRESAESTLPLFPREFASRPTCRTCGHECQFRLRGQALVTDIGHARCLGSQDRQNPTKQTYFRGIGERCGAVDGVTTRPGDARSAYRSRPPKGRTRASPTRRPTRAESDRAVLRGPLIPRRPEPRSTAR